MSNGNQVGFPENERGAGEAALPIGLMATGRFRFPKICSRIEFLEIANFDGKMGKFRVT